MRRQRQDRDALRQARADVLEVQDRLACLLVGLVRILGEQYPSPVAALASAFDDPDSSGRIEVRRDAFGRVDGEWLQDQAVKGAAQSQALARHVLALIDKELANG